MRVAECATGRDESDAVFGILTKWFSSTRLKHGPRSLTYMRVLGCRNPGCVMKVKVAYAAEVGTGNRMVIGALSTDRHL